SEVCPTFQVSGCQKHLLLKNPSRRVPEKNNFNQASFKLYPPHCLKTKHFR
ncbi:hypothetical protein BgiMline_002385, partial [Biomphalaria glabrata]